MEMIDLVIASVRMLGWVEQNQVTPLHGRQEKKLISLKASRLNVKPTGWQETSGVRRGHYYTDAFKLKGT